MAAHPRYKEAWASCPCCGFDVPKSKIRYHYRFGWQCTGAPGLNCWAGGPHVDEMKPPIHPGEGTRRTSAPLTNTATEGLT